MARGKKEKKEQKKKKKERKILSFFLSFFGKNRTARMLVWFFFALFFLMAGFNLAGPVGSFFYHFLLFVPFSYAWFLFPLFFLFLLWKEHVHSEFRWREGISFLILLFSVSSLLSLFSEKRGGIIGKFLSHIFVSAFDIYFSFFLFLFFSILALISLSDLSFSSFLKKDRTKEKKEEEKENSQKTQIKLKEKKEAILNSLTQIKKEDNKKEEKKEKKKKKEEEEFSVHEIFSHQYKKPPLSLLTTSSGRPSTGDIKANANLIQRTLMNFGIPVEMDEISIGPTVTRYAIKPAQGIRLSRIASLQNEIALALAAKSIRIEAPIPGRSLVGIEVPNKVSASIGLGSLLSEDQFQEAKEPLLISLGKGVSGESYFADLSKMPHALIAGATGSGKSVTIHNIIISLLYRNGPDILRFILIDPKRVELTLYKKIPHLLSPVITDPKKAVLALKWAVREMERRYNVLQSYAVRDIHSYHTSIVKPAYADLDEEEILSLEDELPEKMPYIVIIMDELSDIMSAYPRELEASIVRLAQMSRAVGIHLILATQRPSVNVITGLIKANIPTRMALKVTSQIDSRTILDARGAEKLLGKGDMLYKGEGSNEAIRIQCPYVSEKEVKSVVSFIQKNSRFSLDDEIVIPEEELNEDVVSSFETSEEGADDPLYEEARAIVVSAQKASTSYLQRRLSIGYSRAARIMDLLEERGVIGPSRGSKPREVYEKVEDINEGKLE